MPVVYLGLENDVATTAAMIVYTLKRFSRSIHEQIRRDEGMRQASRILVDGEYGRFYLRIIMGKHWWRKQRTIHGQDGTTRIEGQILASEEDGLHPRLDEDAPRQLQTR